jgi:ParB family transcriptional regulator, chromosome partitioning protein
MSNASIRRPALGKGLDALLPSRAAAPPAPVAAPVSDGQPREIALELLDPSPYQTRSAMDAVQLEELSKSIAATGVVQPIIVRALPNGRFQLIAGERRWRASEKAGKTTVPTVVRNVSDEQAMEMTIVENLQRADLNAMEQARAYERLSREFKMTQEQMAQRTGKERASVANYLRLLKLPVEVQLHVEKGALSYGHARALLGLAHEEEMMKVALDVLTRDLSVRQTERVIQEILNPEKAAKEEKAAPPVDPNVREAQEQLQRSLGLKVKIEDKKGKGRVIIEYSGVDDFDTILMALVVNKI